MKLQNRITFLLYFLSVFMLFGFTNNLNDVLFEKYECISTNFPLNEPDFESNKDYKRFKTIINEKCKEGINFANRYTIVTWGCGTNCQYSILVDRKDGKIYDGVASTYGLTYKQRSRVLIVNDPKNFPEDGTPLDTTRYYLVDNGTLEEINP